MDEGDPYRCPNCGARLEFSSDQPGGYCPIENIRVDVEKPEGAQVEGNVADVMALEDGEDEESEDGVEENLDTLLAGVSDDPMPDGDPTEDQDESTDIDTLLSELDGDEASAPGAAPDDPAEPPTTTDARRGRTYLGDDPEEPPVVPRVSAKRLRRDRFAFYLGTILVSMGGIGLTLGSVLHDALRVPWFGSAFGTFGPLNATAAGSGFLLLLIGLVALWRGLRGGILPADAAGG
ncbi:MAG TPA: hypothetical protein VGR51_00945 [Thermoplasmata archaeon]|jgi:hypothetical protein|nr:hypothetical protein [Thermoplasmata archaeon]